MKKHIYQLIIAFLICMPQLSNAQNEEGKIKIKIIENINGTRHVIEKTYQSKEEMLNDPELKDRNINITEDNGMSHHKYKKRGDANGIIELIVDSGNGLREDTGVFFYSKGMAIDSGRIKLNKLDDEAGTFIESGENTFEVIKDEDGQITIFKNGEKVTDDSFKSGEGTFIDLHDDGIKSMMVIRSNTNGGDSVKAVLKIHKILVERLGSKDNELKKLALKERKELVLDNFTYYPNPSNGLLNIKFSSRPVPTKVQLLDISGQTIYEENLQGFEGQYDNALDLSEQVPGIYILRVIQGDNALSKKIIIE